MNVKAYVGAPAFVWLFLCMFLLLQDYWEYFAPDYNLQIKTERKRNYNSEKYLSCLREKIMENLRHLTAAPSVQMQEVPSFYYPSDDEDEEDTEGTTGDS